MSQKKYSKTLFAANWHKIHKEGELLFNDLFSPRHPFSEQIWHPHTDIYEIKDALVIKMEIPGIKPENVSISVVGKKLTIRGTRYDQDVSEILSYHQMEINYCDFERTFILSESLENEEIRADYENGFLIVKVCKICDKEDVYKTIDVQ